MKQYIFYFRFNDTPAFQYLSTFIEAPNHERAILNFHTLFAASGYLEGLENHTFSAMGERSAIDDITVSYSALNVIGFTILFGEDPMEKLLRKGGNK